MEEKNIDELLSEEIAAQIKDLSDLQSGTKEKSTAIDDLTKLYKLRIEENKSVWDADEKYNRRMMDGESVTKDNGKTTNILNCLDKNADWFQLAKGDNIFAYTAEYGSTNLQFKIENRIVYEGV